MGQCDDMVKLTRRKLMGAAAAMAVCAKGASVEAAALFLGAGPSGGGGGGGTPSGPGIVLNAKLNSQMFIDFMKTASQPVFVTKVALPLPAYLDACGAPSGVLPDDIEYLLPGLPQSYAGSWILEWNAQFTTTATTPFNIAAPVTVNSISGNAICSLGAQSGLHVGTTGASPGVGSVNFSFTGPPPQNMGLFFRHTGCNYNIIAIRLYRADQASLLPALGVMPTTHSQIFNPQYLTVVGGMPIHCLRFMDAMNINVEMLPGIKYQPRIDAFSYNTTWFQHSLWAGTTQSMGANDTYHLDPTTSGLGGASTPFAATWAANSGTVNLTGTSGTIVSGLTNLVANKWMTVNGKCVRVTSVSALNFTIQTSIGGITGGFAILDRTSIHLQFGQANTHTLSTLNIGSTRDVQMLQFGCQGLQGGMNAIPCTMHHNYAQFGGAQTTGSDSWDGSANTAQMTGTVSVAGDGITCTLSGTWKNGSTGPGTTHDSILAGHYIYFNSAYHLIALAAANSTTIVLTAATAAGTYTDGVYYYNINVAGTTSQIHGTYNEVQYSSISGPGFSVGDTITGSTSRAHGTYVGGNGSTLLYIEGVNGGTPVSNMYTPGESVTNGAGTTAVITFGKQNVVNNIGRGWVTIAPNDLGTGTGVWCAQYAKNPLPTTNAGWTVNRFGTLVYEARLDAWLTLSAAGNNTQTPAAGIICLGFAPSIPLAVQVHLCNAFNCNLWMNYPIMTDEESCAQAVSHVCANLNSGLSLYTEVSNEIWNPAFIPQNYYLSLGPVFHNIPPGNNKGFYSPHGYMVARLAEVGAAAWGARDASEYRPNYMVQAGGDATFAAYGCETQLVTTANNFPYDYSVPYNGVPPVTHGNGRAIDFCYALGYANYLGPKQAWLAANNNTGTWSATLCTISGTTLTIPTNSTIRAPVPGGNPLQDNKGRISIGSVLGWSNQTSGLYITTQLTNTETPDAHGKRAPCRTGTYKLNASAGTVGPVTINGTWGNASCLTIMCDLYWAGNLAAAWEMHDADIRYGMQGAKQTEPMWRNDLVIYPFWDNYASNIYPGKKVMTYEGGYGNDPVSVNFVVPSHAGGPWSASTCTIDDGAGNPGNILTVSGVTANQYLTYGSPISQTAAQGTGTNRGTTVTISGGATTDALKITSVGQTVVLENNNTLLFTICTVQTIAGNKLSFTVDHAIGNVACNIFVGSYVMGQLSMGARAGGVPGRDGTYTISGLPQKYTSQAMSGTGLDASFWAKDYQVEFSTSNGFRTSSVYQQLIKDHLNGWLNYDTNTNTFPAWYALEGSLDFAILTDQVDTLSHFKNYEAIRAVF
jgi:hypothetical protein